ncbi:MAG: DoxX family protein [Acidobacteriota bacterium]|nr:DoxX family protein [Acidobacteriota bacterium]
MFDASAVPSGEFVRLEQQHAWRSALNWTAAILIAAVFLVAGIWKASDPERVAVMLSQLKVPQTLSIPLAICLGIAETFTGVMLLVPRFRRLGSIAASLLLVAFMLYIGIHYTELRGADCSCFPWLKRTVGPGFFIGDALMLALAVGAGVGTQALSGIRIPSVVLGAVVVFTLVSYGVNAARHTGTKAPATIKGEDGKVISLTEGKVFIYFFNPQCLHCLDAGKRLAALKWGDTHFIGIPTENPQYGDWFMGKAGLTGKGPVSDDLELLKKVFPFDLPPAGVALEDGYEKAMLLQFEDAEPGATLRKIGFAQ